MKNFSLAILITLLPACLFSQDIVARTNIINVNITESYHVLKSDKKTRHGSYQLLFNRNYLPGDKSVIVAEGEYVNGKKIGIWTYYSGKLLTQKYDYDQGAIIYNAPDITVTYDIKGVKKGDSVRTPVKIGGKVAGYTLLLSNFNSRELVEAFRKDAKTNERLRVEHLFYLDENGKLVNWEAKATINNVVKIYKQNIEVISEDHTAFSPALINGKKVPSIIIYQYFIGVETRQIINSGH